MAGHTFTVYQSADFPNCDFITISPSIQTVNHGGGSFNASVLLATQTQCSWTASANVSWITITSGSSGTGNGTISYTVSTNNSGAIRSGTISATGYGATANQTVTQKQ
jgi:hypothetical protein